MKAAIAHVDSPRGCEPITANRVLSACLVANRSIDHWQKTFLGHAGCTIVDSPAETELWVRGDAWLCVEDLELLMAFEKGSRLLDANGSCLAWLGSSAEPSEGASSVVARGNSFRIEYAWDFLRINGILVGALSEDRIKGTVSPGVNIEGHITLGAGSRLLPGVFIEGNAVIGSNCKIGPNCYIRGDTTIGDGCHIGQAVEIKNSILYPNVGMGHLSYCGDSIIGEGTNFGAGTITANFRHDGANHRSMVEGELVDTGRRKLGAIIGDDVHTGIHTSIYPGRKLWPHTSTRPGDVVQKDLV